MIKKATQITLSMLAAAMLLTSCYSYTAVVGKGPQTNQAVKKWNHYVVYGLAPVGVSDSKELIGDAKDYTINVQHSFVNGLVAALTLGIYTPTTTTVTK
ncbi:hypothetical protein GS399_18170 [Pedobacter sp. HMF7647]|uniref:Bor protein n=1 Tax=Hufsiella arboris TaxID=2695275 RepID=A0A7K1YE67_9SPHI|nr:Bor family protein [Hufsiella arboris]MXV52904.1 hypothetical protein [Hufsiella arboris]